MRANVLHSQLRDEELRELEDARRDLGVQLTDRADAR